MTNDTPSTQKKPVTPVTQIKFNINFMLMMLACGRTEMAQTACQKALDLCDELILNGD